MCRRKVTFFDVMLCLSKICHRIVSNGTFSRHHLKMMLGLFRTKDAVREHGRNHAEQDRVSAIHFATVSESVCQFEADCELTTKHYHCTWVSAI